MADSHPFQLPCIEPKDALLSAAAGATLVDLRKQTARQASGEVISGAEIRDPFQFDHTDPLMSASGPIIAFCVHGHEVSQFGCALLLLHGREACYVRGGFEALLAAGTSVEELD